MQACVAEGEDEGDVEPPAATETSAAKLCTAATSDDAEEEEDPLLLPPEYVVAMTPAMPSTAASPNATNFLRRFCIRWCCSAAACAAASCEYEPPGVIILSPGVLSAFIPLNPDALLCKLERETYFSHCLTLYEKRKAVSHSLTFNPEDDVCSDRARVKVMSSIPLGVTQGGSAR